MADEVKRLNYFNGQFLRDNDFKDEQKYHISQQREHYRLMHTPGIAEGLAVTNPPAIGPTSVSIAEGVAYDDQGRRIVLASSLTRNLDSFTANAPVYVTITYEEQTTDSVTEGGFSGDRRVKESAKIEASETAPSNRTEKLVLAKVLRTGTNVSAIEVGERLRAGAKGGDLAVNTLTMASDAVAPNRWTTMRLVGNDQTQLSGNLEVGTNLTVTGTISGNLAANIVNTAAVTDLAVTTAKLADGAVTGVKIATGAVGSTQIANQAVNTAQIADNAINAAKILDGAVGNAELANAAVTTAKLADLNVTEVKLANAAVTTAKLADLNVTEVKLANAAVTTGKLADGAVTGVKIATGAVGSTQIANLAVNTAQIADNAINAAKILDGAVGNAELANAAVTTAKLADLNVTDVKLATAAVTTAKLADLNVTEVKLANAAVTTGKLADGAVTPAKLAAAVTAAVIPVIDSGGKLNAAEVESALAEVLGALEKDHFRFNEANGGQHRTIRQPAINDGSGKTLLWDASGIGVASTRMRVYADTEYIWFTLNASWDGTAWVRDSTSFLCGGLRIGRSDFALLHENSFAATFTTWSRTWLLPMSGTVNSAFELQGSVREVGRASAWHMNSDPAGTRSILSGGTVTFRNRFPATPSSVTFTTSTSYNYGSSTPNTWYVDRDGFTYYYYASIPALGTAYWVGNYTAIA
jgi:hypothetical protein